MRLSQIELLRLITRFGGYDDDASTEHAMHMFSYFRAHGVGFLDSMATATKVLEVLASVSPEQNALVCENLLLLHQDLNRDQN